MKNRTYLQLDSVTYFRLPIKYSDEEKDKIASYFPKRSQKVALAETLDHVTILVSCLSSETVPQNIKKSKEIEKINKLYMQLDALGELLKTFKSTDQAIIKIKQAFYQLTKTNFKSLSELIACTKAACQHTLKTYNSPGGPYPH